MTSAARNVGSSPSTCEAFHPRSDSFTFYMNTHADPSDILRPIHLEMGAIGPSNSPRPAAGWVPSSQGVAVEPVAVMRSSRLGLAVRRRPPPMQICGLSGSNVRSNDPHCAPPHAEHPRHEHARRVTSWVFDPRSPFNSLSKCSAVSRSIGGETLIFRD